LGEMTVNIPTPLALVVVWRRLWERR
jgi:hypothetical protein